MLGELILLCVYESRQLTQQVGDTLLRPEISLEGEVRQKGHRYAKPAAGKRQTAKNNYGAWAQ